MKSQARTFPIAFLFLNVVCLSIVAAAQLGVRGQIFLPNGSPPPRPIRFTLLTDNGVRSDIMFTDSNGRIAMNRIDVPYTILVETDGENYDTTRVSFNPVHAGNYIVVNLKPIIDKNTPSPPGLVRADTVDAHVSPKARQAYEEATKLLQARKYEQASELLKQAIALQPNYVQAHNDLGAAYMKRNQLDRAEETLRQAMKLNDRWYLPQLNLGVVLNRQRKHKGAAKLLTQLRNNHPDQPQIHPPLIEALIESHQWPQAEEELQRALAVKGSDTVDLKIKLGMVTLRQSKFPAAVAALREATSAEPDNALAQFNLGAALLESRNLDEAETALLRAYQIGGAKMPGVQLQLGQLYFRKKNYPKAIEAFEAYLRDLPNAPNAAQVKEAVDKLRQAYNKP
ncbi:MAG: tetratricopeptide repeat protein [Acidobacteriota bacterium]